jgi:nitrite reductase/ring-hydroxylating ferredoxin subunit
MVATVLAYAFSLIARLSGSRGTGKLFSNTGYGLLSFGAYVGGSQVYDIGYGVNHTAFEHGPGEFVPVMAESKLSGGKPTKVDAQGVPVMLVKQSGQVYALGDTCVHAGCSLSGGRLEGASIVCPCHGSQFDLKDGSVINGPATMPEPRYEVRVENGMIQVKQA